MEQQKDYLTTPGSVLQPLPNATISLVMGILSIVFCGLGIILGIVGIVLANKDMALYRNNPGVYSEASFNNTKAGRICSIIGIILSTLIILFYILAIVFAFGFLTTTDAKWN
jgi:hypothetical protein